MQGIYLFTRLRPSLLVRLQQFDLAIDLLLFAGSRTLGCLIEHLGVRKLIHPAPSVSIRSAFGSNECSRLANYLPHQPGGRYFSKLKFCMRAVIA